MLVAGSGMGRGLLAREGGLGLEIEAEVALEHLGMPAPKVEGHGTSLVFGRIAGRRVCVQSGRIHPYEGHEASLCTAALGAMFRIGVGAIVLTAAVGGLAGDLQAGQLVVLRDQMNLLGPTPLRGPHFIDCADLYDAALRKRLSLLAGTALREGVYAYARGPQYETPAETEALRRLGGDVVGMSTTYEAILAAAHSVPCAGIAVVTNVAGVSGLNHDEVQHHADRAREGLARLLAGLFGLSPSEARR
jgi:purine-nucleoside phosphorylase